MYNLIRVNDYILGLTNENGQYVCCGAAQSFLQNIQKLWEEGNKIQAKINASCLFYSVWVESGCLKGEVVCTISL